MELPLARARRDPDGVGQAQCLAVDHYLLDLHGRYEFIRFKVRRVDGDDSSDRWKPEPAI